MRKIILILLVLIITSCAKTGLHVINNFAKSGQFETYKNISYGEQKLNLYIPKDKAITATVIYFYGGVGDSAAVITRMIIFLLPKP